MTQVGLLYYADPLPIKKENMLQAIKKNIIVEIIKRENKTEQVTELTTA